jgi:Na+/proline symporter
VYILGGVATLIVALHLAGGIGSFARAYHAYKLITLDFNPSFIRTYTFWSGIIGGALLSAASHGTDQLIVQRLLAARGLGDARKALIGSGVFIIFQFALFLLVGTSLWLAGGVLPDMSSDQIYATFVITKLPAGLAGLVVAGLLAAAMGTHASAVNSLASASTYDFYAPLKRVSDPTHLLRIGRIFTVVWAVVLVVGAMLFPNHRTPVVELALQAASLTYGALLGTYVLGGFWRRARERDVIVAMIAGVALMIPVIFAGRLAAAFNYPPLLVSLSTLAWPWDVPLGTALTVLCGMASSMVGTSDGGKVGS